jgi:hypothetical protein
LISDAEIVTWSREREVKELNSTFDEAEMVPPVNDRSPEQLNETVSPSDSPCDPEQLTVVTSKTGAA